MIRTEKLFLLSPDLPLPNAVLYLAYKINKKLLDIKLQVFPNVKNIKFENENIEKFVICWWPSHCTKKMNFSIKDFFSKCDKIRSFLRFWSHLLKKP